MEFVRITFFTLKHHFNDHYKGKIRKIKQTKVEFQWEREFTHKKEYFVVSFCRIFFRLQFSIDFFPSRKTLYMIIQILNAWKFLYFPIGNFFPFFLAAKVELDQSFEKHLISILAKIELAILNCWWRVDKSSTHKTTHLHLVYLAYLSD